MSNEFSKFVAGLRLQARAAASADHKGNIAWRGSPAAGSRARRMRGIYNV
jgi:hypothetical protein